MAATLHLAAYDGNLAAASSVIEQDASLVDADGDYGKTPLLTAAENGHTELVRYLLDHNADIHHRDEEDMDALEYANLEGHVEVVALLLKRGTDASECIALRMACGDADVVSMLLEHILSTTGDINRLDGLKRTALHDYVLLNRPDSVRQLLDAGADAWLRDSDGYAAVDLAFLQGHDECARILEDHDREYNLWRAHRVGDEAVAL